MKYNVFDQHKNSSSGSTQNVFSQFLQTKGLYDSMEITEGNIQDLIDLLNGNVRISTYCKQCKAERVFSMEPVVCYVIGRGEYEALKVSDIIHEAQKFYCSTSNNPLYAMLGNTTDVAKEKSRLIVFEFVCAMNNSHHLDFVVLTDNSTF